MRLTRRRGKLTLREDLLSPVYFGADDVLSLPRWGFPDRVKAFVSASIQEARSWIRFPLGVSSTVLTGSLPTFFLSFWAKAFG